MSRHEETANQPTARRGRAGKVAEIGGGGWIKRFGVDTEAMQRGAEGSRFGFA